LQEIVQETKKTTKLGQGSGTISMDEKAKSEKASDLQDQSADKDQINSESSATRNKLGKSRHSMPPTFSPKMTAEKPTTESQLGGKS
jgi:hypothetical protein